MGFFILIDANLLILFFLFVHLSKCNWTAMEYSNFLIFLLEDNRICNYHVASCTLTLRILCFHVVVMLSRRLAFTVFWFGFFFFFISGYPGLQQKLLSMVSITHDQERLSQAETGKEES